MLPKKNRIPRSLFPKALNMSKRYVSTNLILNFVENTDSKTKEIKKFAFLVSKKVSKSAVLRNKYRRWGYSIVSKNIKKIKEGPLFVFVYKKNNQKLTYNTIEKEVVELLSSSGVLI